MLFKIVSGVISLKKLRNFAEKNRISYRDNKDREYRKFVRELINLDSKIPEGSGWYCWGKGNKNGFLPKYIGQSRIGKTSSIKVRLADELMEEKMFIWNGIETEKTQLEKLIKAYPKMGRKRLKDHLDRALLKSGSTHIVWVVKLGSIKREEMNAVEYGLIGKFEPYANIRKGSYAEEAKKIAEFFNKKTKKLYSKGHNT